MAKGKYEEWLTEEGLLKLEGWARDGLTEEQIAKNMGISRSTLKDWKKKYPAILTTIKNGKEVVDRQVENALFKRATGFQFQEETYVSVEMSREEYDLRVSLELEIWNRKNPEATRAERELFILSIPRTKQVLEKRTIKQMAPETTAQIFWLKNRKPDQWRDKRDQNINFNPADLSDAEIEELLTDE